MKQYYFLGLDEDGLSDEQKDAIHKLQTGIGSGNRAMYAKLALEIIQVTHKIDPGPPIPRRFDQEHDPPKTSCQICHAELGSETLVRIHMARRHLLTAFRKVCPLP